jgi:hypothetical protein
MCVTPLRQKGLLLTGRPIIATDNDNVVCRRYIVISNVSSVMLFQTSLVHVVVIKFINEYPDLSSK